jgi:hypothetical protein
VPVHNSTQQRQHRISHGGTALVFDLIEQTISLALRHRLLVDLQPTARDDASDPAKAEVVHAP